MKAALRKDALSETYTDIEKLIYDIVWKFKDRYGGDIGELVAEANLIYVLAFDSYNETKGALSTWMHFCIRKGLLDFLKSTRQQNRYGLKFYPLSEAKGVSIQKFRPLHLLEMLEEVGEDAKVVIRLVFYPPEGITKEDLEGGFSACRCRRYLRQYLHDLGWTGRRIKESFQEIRRILCE